MPTSQSAHVRACELFLLAVAELRVCSEGASFANSTETSRPQCLSCPQPTCQVPHASKQLQSVRQHRRDSIGLLQDLVQDQVDCTPEEQRRRERVDPERLLHAWHGRQSPAKEAFSFSTTCRGFKPNQVGARKNLVLSMPVMNLLRSTSMCCSLALLAILSSHML